MSSPARKIIPILVLLCAAALLALVLLVSQHADTKRQRPAPEADVSYRRPVGRPSVTSANWSWSFPPAGSAPAPSSPSPQRDVPGIPSVGGLVVDEDGQLVAGAAVFVLGEGLAFGEGVAQRTGPDGRFIIADQSLGKFVTVEVRHPDYARASVAAFRDQPNIVIRLRRALSVAGSIDAGHGACEASLTYASSGRSLAGQVTTGPGGEFKFPKVAPSADYVIQVECPDAYGAGKLVSVGAESVSGVAIQLRPGIEVAGRCVNAAGTPMAGHRVVHWSPSYSESATGADGRFRFKAARVGVGAARFMVGNGVSYEVNNFGLFERSSGQVGVVDLGSIACDGDSRTVAVYSPEELTQAIRQDFKRIVED